MAQNLQGMTHTSLSRQGVVVLALGVLVSTLLERDASAAAAVVAFEEAVPLGSKECPLDISVLWTADVDSPVYSTPVIRPSSVDGRKQLVLASLRSAVELLRGDGSVPYPWPVEMDGATFLASPALHDVNGDGIQDFCVADMEGLIHWLTPGGEGGPYLRSHRRELPGFSVEKDYAFSFAGDREKDSQSGVAENAAAAGVAGGGDAGSEAEEGREGFEAAKRRALLGLNENPRLGRGGEDPRAGVVSPSESGSEFAAESTSDYPTKLVGGTGGRKIMGVEAEEEASGAYRDSANDLAERASSAGYWAGFPAPDDTGEGYWESFDDDYGLRWNGVSSVRSRGGHTGESRSAVGHVLASPVFADVNGDGQEEMIVPISYFFDRRMQDFSDLEGCSPETFVAGTLGCWDFKTKKWLWTYSLGQTKGEAEKVAFVYSSPTVCDLDGDGDLEVIVGTGDGGLHVLDATTGVARGGFPLQYDEIRGQVAVADVDGDGQELEMVVGDASGVVACVKQDGTECWRERVPGSIKSMVTLGDVDGDGSLDVVVGVTTKEGAGEVWALSAESKLHLPHFPVNLGNRKGISNAITLVDLHENTAGTAVGGKVTADASGQGKRGAAGGGVPIGGRGPGLHLLVPSEDGHVYAIEGATGCVNKIDLGERVLSMVLADDLDGDGTLELVVGTASGEVVALSANVPFHPLNSWTSSVRGQLNGFVHGGYQGVHFLRTRSGYGDVVGRQFSLSFEIVDNSPSRRRDGDGVAGAKGAVGGGGDKPYKITISAGKEEILHRNYRRAGVHTVTLSLKSPKHALLRIEMTNGQRLYFEDYVFVGYNTSFHAPLKWMLVAPVVLAALLFLWVQPASRTHLPA